ncbi:MAG: dCMP deaminase family protein [candidate division Zixibacteria bacterium]|nr:dCMP deaminase family protein [candidate division Zixibacteria bacterium]MDD5425514.1 dCMP deaminase family protein [candidate division Zixibacteria bacterium]
MVTKRTDYISWDDYFMAVAQLSALRSKDPSTRVGACIVNKNKRIIGIGYNGFPSGCSDDILPWAREGDFLQTKYPYVCHAEMNAITNASNKPDLEGATLYVSLFPCNECAKLIVQVGIKEVVYLSDKYHGQDIFVAARKIFEMAGVKLRQLIPQTTDIKLSLTDGEQQ